MSRGEVIGHNYVCQLVAQQEYDEEILIVHMGACMLRGGLGMQLSTYNIADIDT